MNEQTWEITYMRAGSAISEHSRCLPPSPSLLALKQAKAKYKEAIQGGDVDEMLRLTPIVRDLTNIVDDEWVKQARTETNP